MRSKSSLPEQRGNHAGFFKRFISRISIRFASTFAVMFLLSSLILYWGTFLTLYQGLQQSDGEERQLRMLQIWAQFQAGGIDLLRLEIEMDQLDLGERPYAFRISDISNRTLLLYYPSHWKAFDFRSLETAPRNRELLTLSSREREYDLEFASVPLSGEYILQVGTSTEHREQLLHLYRNNFMLIVAFLIPVSVGIGALLSSRSIHPLRTVNAAVDRIIATGDMSERVSIRGTGDELDELAHRFNQMLDRIATLISELKGTLDTVAHDLKTPIARFRGIAERVLQEEDDVEEYRQALAVCMEESEHIVRLINTLMDITEAETGVMRLDSQRLHLRRLAEEVIEVYSYVAEEKGVALLLQAGDDPEVSGDPVRLRQAVGNLIDNAVKYSRPGGQVTVSVHMDMPGDDSHRYRAVLKVRDRGIGIPPDDLPYIWNRLYRGTGGRSQPGLGLGLSLVKAVVQAHGGTVDAGSNSEDGTVFSISLPLE